MGNLGHTQAVGKENFRMRKQIMLQYHLEAVFRPRSRLEWPGAPAIGEELFICLNTSATLISPEALPHLLYKVCVGLSGDTTATDDQALVRPMAAHHGDTIIILLSPSTEVCVSQYCTVQHNRSESVMVLGLRHRLPQDIDATST
jgi:hypothetical protein